MTNASKLFEDGPNTRITKPGWRQAAISQKKNRKIAISQHWLDRSAPGIVNHIDPSKRNGS